MYGQLIWQRVYNGGKAVFSINGVGKIRQLLAKEWNATTILHCTQKLPQWIKNLNVRSETIKFLEESRGGQLLDIGLGDEFWNLIPK